MNKPVAIEGKLTEVNVAVPLMTCTSCSGAELQVFEGETIVLRELYPLKSDLYERARELEIVYRGRMHAAFSG